MAAVDIMLCFSLNVSVGVYALAIFCFIVSARGRRWLFGSGLVAIIVRSHLCILAGSSFLQEIVQTVL